MTDPTIAELADPIGALLGVDPERWADTFIDAALPPDYAADAEARGIIVGWFANAIGAGQAIDALERVRATTVADAYLHRRQLDDRLNADAEQDTRTVDPDTPARLWAEMHEAQTTALQALDAWALYRAEHPLPVAGDAP